MPSVKNTQESQLRGWAPGRKGKIAQLSQTIQERYRRVHTFADRRVALRMLRRLLRLRRLRHPGGQPSALFRRVGRHSPTCRSVVREEYVPAVRRRITAAGAGTVLAKVGSPVRHAPAMPRRRNCQARLHQFFFMSQSNNLGGKKGRYNLERR